MAFRVGQKVVCVDGGSWFLLLGERLPVEGQIYTIRGLRSAKSVWLEEITNEPKVYADGFVECSFLNHRFRPVVERELDISVFTKMLKTKQLERL